MIEKPELLAPVRVSFSDQDMKEKDMFFAALQTAELQEDRQYSPQNENDHANSPQCYTAVYFDRNRRRASLCNRAANQH